MIGRDKSFHPLRTGKETHTLIFHAIRFSDFLPKWRTATYFI